VSSQPESAVEQQLQKLFVNLLRTFGKQGALSSGLTSEDMLGEAVNDHLKGEPPEDADVQVTSLCDEIADECRRIRKIQSVMGYRDHFSKSA